MGGRCRSLLICGLGALSIGLLFVIFEPVLGLEEPADGQLHRYAGGGLIG